MIRSQVIGCDYSLLGNGYIDTTKGAVLTSEKVLMLIREKENRGREARIFADLEAERKAGKRAQNDEKTEGSRPNEGISMGKAGSFGRKGTACVQGLLSVHQEAPC